LESKVEHVHRLSVLKKTSVARVEKKRKEGKKTTSSVRVRRTSLLKRVYFGLDCWVGWLVVSNEKKEKKRVSVRRRRRRASSVCVQAREEGEGGGEEGEGRKRKTHVL